MAKEKSLINKWSHLKSEIKRRPILGLKLGLSAETLHHYYYHTPPDDEILRVEAALYQDRAEKTRRIRDELSKVVGHREAVKISQKIGISDSKLRDSMGGKDLTPSYDIIAKIEFFLFMIFGFDVSLENEEFKSAYLDTLVDNLSSKVNSIGVSLLRCSENMAFLKKYPVNKNYPRLSSGDEYYLRGPLSAIAWDLKKLTEVQEEIQIFMDTYVRKVKDIR
jgi:hypothetical protein